VNGGRTTEGGGRPLGEKGQENLEGSMGKDAYGKKRERELGGGRGRGKTSGSLV